MTARLLVATLLSAILACAPPAPAASPSVLAPPTAATSPVPAPPASTTSATSTPAPATPISGPDIPGVEGAVALVRGGALIVREHGSARAVFRAAPGGAITGPAWSPDGRLLAFAQRTPPPPRAAAGSPEQFGRSDIIVVDAAGANPRVVAPSDRSGTRLEAPAWSGDGHALAYTYYPAATAKDRAQPPTVEVRRQALADGAALDGPPTTVARDAMQPAASPDDVWIAYVAFESGRGFELRMAPTGGGEARVLVPAGQFRSVLGPRFSPDGTMLAFAAVASPGSSSLRPRAAAPAERIWGLIAPVPAYAHGASWEVWTVPTAGGAARQRTRINEDTPSAAWSPDGRRLLVQAEAGVYLVGLEDDTTTLLTRDGALTGIDWRRRA